MIFGGVTGASTWISYIVVDANQLGAMYHMCHSQAGKFLIWRNSRNFPAHEYLLVYKAQVYTSVCDLHIIASICCMFEVNSAVNEIAFAH